jgi:sec-independent protein translocase protein TatA
LPNVGPTELLVILVIALLVFGPKRLPEIGRTIGKSLREFRQASSDLRGEIQRNLDLDAPPSQPSPPSFEPPKEPPAPEAGSGPEANGTS